MGTRRILRLGCRGSDVRSLQERLQECGYSLGTADGRFGHLTMHALEKMQRDCGLRIDGIAGREVAAFFRYHPKFGASARMRELWGYDQSEPREAFTGFYRFPSRGGTADQELAMVTDKLSMAMLTIGDSAEIHNLLTSQRLQQQTAVSMGRLACRFDVMYIGCQQMPRRDGFRLERFCNRLKRDVLSTTRLYVEVSATMVGWRLLGAIDLNKLARIADRLVVTLPQTDGPGPCFTMDQLKDTISFFRSRVPCWKMLLGLPAHALLWPEEGGGDRHVLDSSQARELATRHGVKWRQDSSGHSFCRVWVSPGGMHRLYLPSTAQLVDALRLAARRRLAGVIIQSPGPLPKMDSIFLAVQHMYN